MVRLQLSRTLSMFMYFHRWFNRTLLRYLCTQFCRTEKHNWCGLVMMYCICVSLIRMMWCARGPPILSVRRGLFLGCGRRGSLRFGSSLFFSLLFFAHQLGIAAMLSNETSAHRQISDEIRHFTNPKYTHRARSIAFAIVNERAASMAVVPGFALLHSQIVGAHSLVGVGQLLLVLRTGQISLISTCMETNVCMRLLSFPDSEAMLFAWHLRVISIVEEYFLGLGGPCRF